MRRECSVRALLVAEITLVCAIYAFDTLLLMDHPPFLRAIYDNLGHATIAAAVWAACTRPMQHNTASNATAIKFRAFISAIIRRDVSIESFECAFSFAVGSLLDADHFLAAGSFSFYEATHLQQRPFGHSVIVVTSLLVRYVFPGIYAFHNHIFRHFHFCFYISLSRLLTYLVRIDCCLVLV
jgi:hypothetical protein